MVIFNFYKSRINIHLLKSDFRFLSAFTDPDYFLNFGNFSFVDFF